MITDTTATTKNSKTWSVQLDHYLYGYPLTSSTCHLEIQSLSFGQEKQQLHLNNFSLQAKPGEQIALVVQETFDPTALFGLLTGLYQTNNGEILVDKTNIKRLSRWSLRQRVGMVLQEPWIINGTIRDNIIFGLPTYNTEAVQAAAQLARVDEFTEDLPDGLDTRIEDSNSNNGTQLTQGQKRRIAIARTILRDPAIVLLDEPTANLSAEESAHVAAAIEQVTQGRTAITVTSEASDAQTADQILVVDKGQIVEHGTHDELITQRNSTYFRMRTNQIPTQPIDYSHPSTSKLWSRSESMWGFKIGQEIVPGYIAADLIEQTGKLETWSVWDVVNKTLARVTLPRTTEVEFEAYEQLRNHHKLADELDHPSFPKVLAADNNAEIPYLVCEFIDGRLLSSTINRHGPAQTTTIISLGKQIASALAYLHQKEVTLLGLAPQNVIIKRQFVGLTGLHHARTKGTQQNPQRSRKTMAYVAPEQTNGSPASPKMDIYALGALLHHVAVGSTAERNQQRYSQAVHLPSLDQVLPIAPSKLVELLDRMLSPDPTQRPTANETVALLEATSHKTRS